RSRSVETLQHSGLRRSAGNRRLRSRPVNDRGAKADALKQSPDRQGVTGRKLRGNALDRRKESPDAKSDSVRNDEESIGSVAAVDRRPISEPPGHPVAKRKLPGRERGPQRAGIERRERLEPGEVTALPRLVE